MDWHKYFIYIPETGDLIWKERTLEDNKGTQPYAWKRWNSRFSGKLAGCEREKGSYVVINVGDKSNKYAHRIVWEMHNGPIVGNMKIDHINGVRSDNRIENLRIASHSNNLFNRSFQKINKLKLKGVHRHKDKWRAAIQFNRKQKHIGIYLTKGLAALAYAKAAMRYHGDFARVTPYHKMLRGASEKTP
jgi:hypothetical protein